jgi:hypothetical protein
MKLGFSIDMAKRSETSSNRVSPTGASVRLCQSTKYCTLNEQMIVQEDARTSLGQLLFQAALLKPVFFQFSFCLNHSE